MKEIITTITQRGQVTIPAEVRRKLGLRPKGKVAFRIDDGQVRLAPAEYTLESAFGSVTPQKRPEDFKRISREAKDEHAQKTVEEL
ncbi:MAG: type II toxin-antitoxin system PrlF family antitoxin [Chloroflexi bacterium]|nr:type II toxin-antitoxin system PrlF family antitoxin [Chloroflexota bacterium]